MLSKKFKVLLLDTKRKNPNHYICLAIQKALKASSLVESVEKADAHNAINIAATKQCNLFFAFDGEELNHELCLRLRTICGRSVLWVTEDPYEISVNLANAALFDLVFTNDSASAPLYGEKGRHLPLAGARNFHYHPVAAPDRLRYDVFFAGTAWPNRVEFFRDVLKETHNGIKAKIALPTNPHLPPVDIGLPSSQISWRTSPADFARFANLSLATVVLPRVFSASGQNEFAETPPPRMFEAALAGSVQLIQERLVEASSYFEPGREFLYFSSAADFLVKLRSMQSDLDLRTEIANAAQAAALNKHCYEHRVNQVLEGMAKVAAKENSEQGLVIARTPNAKPRLLFVTHNFVRNGNFGGVEVYTEQIGDQLREHYDVFYYAPKEKANSTSAVLMNSEGEVIEQFRFSSPTSPWLNSCAEREAAFSTILCKYGMQVVHFQHLIGHVPSLVHIAKSLGVASAFTVHDYYAICQNFTLLSFKGRYCNPDRVSLSQCDTCLWHTHHVLPGSQGSRRAFWNGVLASTDLLIFNTQGAVDLMASIYPAVSGHPNARVIPVPIKAGEGQPRVNRPQRHAGAIKIAVLGNFTHHKGGSVIARVIPLLKDVNVEFHIFGAVSGEYNWLAKKTAATQMPQVTVHGSYSPGDLPPQLAECDVSLHLSIWPETYCLTLSESWQLGLVPIVSDIGALGERVVHGVNGLKIAPDSEGELVQAIRMLAEDPGLLAVLKGGIKSAPISYISQHFKDLTAAYQKVEVGALRRLGAAAVPGKPLTLADIGVRVEKPNWADTAGAENGPISPALPGLIARAVRHYRHYGIRATARASVRFIRSRI